MLKPTILLNGKVAGVWKRRKKGRKITISLEPFRRLDKREYRLVENAVERYGGYCNTVVEVEG